MAIKLVHEHIADDDAVVARFRLEAQHVAALSHPNIVSVYDWVIDPPRQFMVLELVEGQNLRERLNTVGRLSVSETLEIMAQVLSGLAQAHERGIVHRDIKPENVLLARLSGGAGVAKLSDFGIAKSLADQERLTRTGLIGTPAYIAPELLGGGAPSTASDVYAVGCVIYECLTGQPRRELGPSGLIRITGPKEAHGNAPHHRHRPRHHLGPHRGGGRPRRHPTRPTPGPSHPRVAPGLEEAALAESDPSTSLRIVLEPTGAAWLPVAVFFIRRGHTVFRVSSAKASDLRKFFKRHAKTNQIDALTLAKMPLVDPDRLLPLELAEGAAAALNRRVRVCERLGEQITRHKTRIRELARQMMPSLDEAMDTAFRDADRVVLEHYANPHALAKVPEARLAARIQKETRRGSEYAQRKAAAWISVARAAVTLYGDDPAVAFEDLADEIATEITLLKNLSAELARHETAREQAYLAVDERQIARSLPGVGLIGGPTLVAAMGRPGRFPRAASFRRYTGLTPKASETGESDAKGETMSKAGANWLRRQLVQSANTARQVDPELGRIYYVQMVERGAHHNKAACVVAAHLAERAWVTLLRREPYVLRDLEGKPITIAEGKAIVAEHFKVPEEVRRRRRTKKKGGKVPQVLVARKTSRSRRDDKRGDLPHDPASSSSPTSSRGTLVTA